jgi:hypothetical protein
MSVRTDMSCGDLLVVEGKGLDGMSLAELTLG